MTYSIQIKASAAKALRRIDPPARRRLVDAIDRIAQDPNLGTPLKGNFSELLRLRVGRYRILYTVDRGELHVLVVRIGHRRDVYR